MYIFLRNSKERKSILGQECLTLTFNQKLINDVGYLNSASFPSLLTMTCGSAVVRAKEERAHSR